LEVVETPEKKLAETAIRATA